MLCQAEWDGATLVAQASGMPWVHEGAISKRIARRERSCATSNGTRARPLWHQLAHFAPRRPHWTHGSVATAEPRTWAGCGIHVLPNRPEVWWVEQRPSKVSIPRPARSRENPRGRRLRCHLFGLFLRLCLGVLRDRDVFMSSLRGPGWQDKGGASSDSA